MPWKRRANGPSRSPEPRQGLVAGAPVLHLTGALQQLLDIGDREGVGAINLFEFVPVDGRSDRHARARTDRIRLDGGRCALVAQEVEEDAAATLSLRKRDREPVRRSLCERAAERLGELADLVPLGRGFERHDDVDAFAAGEQGKALQPDGLE